MICCELFLKIILSKSVNKVYHRSNKFFYMLDHVNICNNQPKSRHGYHGT